MVNKSENEIREYMISRAKTCLSGGDPSYAKSWIMTANALFPQNDKIKMESYEMAKCEANVEEAVKYLCEMFATKDCEQQLRRELSRILIACRNEWQTTYRLTEQQIQAAFDQPINEPPPAPPLQQFYSRLFAQLSPEYQYKLLRRVSDRIDDKTVLIDLLLFILKKFPESVAENGRKLIEIMDEKQIPISADPSATDSDQYMRQYLKKKLVFDVLAVIFAENSKLVLEFETIQALMQKTLKYFVEKLIASSNWDRNSDPMDGDGHDGSGGAGSRESDELLENKVKEIFHLIGHKNDWKLFKAIDFVSENQLEVIYDRIAHFIDEYRYSGDTDSPMDLSSATTAKIGGADEQTGQQILYATLLLFLNCLRKYFKLSANIVLIEQSNPTAKGPINKKRKLTEPELLTSDTELRQLFMVASKSLKLLQENLTINSEFAKISEIIGLNACQSYDSFVIDSNIFRAEYSDVLTQIQNKSPKSIKNNLQLISVSLMLHDCTQTVKYCIDSIECLTLKHNQSSGSVSNKNGNSGQRPELPTSTGSARKLYFLALNIDDIMNYIIDVIIVCLRDRVLQTLKPSDLGVGHLLVLSQYKWPQNVPLFLTCMASIRQQTGKVQPKFTYHQFFNYVFIPDIIEEFMSCVDIRDILLELKPFNQTVGTPLKTTSKVITTRGVNKGFKEENRSALIAQMNVSKTSLPNQLFIDFINKEIRAFLTSIHK